MTEKKPMRAAITMAVTATVCNVPPVAAEDHQAEPLSANEAIEQTVRQNASPSMDSSTGFLGSGIQLVAGADSSRIELAATRTVDTSEGDRFSFNAFSLKLTAPLEKDSDGGKFFGEGGLVNDTSLELSFKGASARDTNPSAAFKTRQLLIHKARNTCIEQAGADEEKKEKCAHLKGSEFGEYLSKEEMKTLKDGAWENTPLWLYGLSASIGHKKFDYMDSTSFSELSKTKIPWAISVQGGVNPNSTPLYFGGGYEYKVSYDAAKDSAKCQNSDEPILTCETGAFAPPEKKTTSSLFAVARMKTRWVPFGQNSEPLGLEFKVSYDLKKEVMSVNVPVYLFSDKGLRGGIKLNWDDDKKKIFAGVFIGSTFSLFQ